MGSDDSAVAQHTDSGRSGPGGGDLPPPPARPAGPGGVRPPVPPRAGGRIWAAALVVAVLAAAAAFAGMPFRPPPEPEVRGSGPAAEVLAEHLADPGRYQGAAAFALDPAGASTATAGTRAGAGGGAVGAETPFESGSVWKVFTAMVLADMVERGETRLDRRLGEVFPDAGFASEETADITLEELATHRSGLPSAAGASPARATLDSFLLADPYRALPPVEDALAEVQPAGRGEWAYSNFGFAALGAALAAESGTPYPDLLRERLLDPLGMDATVIAGADTAGVPEGAALPHALPGRTVEPWRSPEYAPAGVGTWTTLADMERFASAVLDGTAPGLSALDPTGHASPIGEDGGHGLAWLLVPAEDGTTAAVHDGSTYGSSAFIAIDREEGRAAAVLANTGISGMPGAVSQELVGMDAAAGADSAGGTGSSAAYLAMTVPAAVLPALLVLGFAVRRKTLVGQRRIDRMRILSLPLGAAAVVAAALPFGAWSVLPPAVWAAAVGTVAGSALVLASYWRRVPWNNARWRWLHYPFFGLSLLASAAVLALTATALAAAP
ncbi:serine hydrolase domain-containing protein [Nocardiopsis coralliicola]